MNSFPSPMLVPKFAVPQVTSCTLPTTVWMIPGRWRKIRTTICSELRVRHWIEHGWWVKTLTLDRGKCATNTTQAHYPIRVVLKTLGNRLIPQYTSEADHRSLWSRLGIEATCYQRPCRAATAGSGTHEPRFSAASRFHSSGWPTHGHMRFIGGQFPGAALACHLPLCSSARRP